MKTRTLACALLLGACGAVNAQFWNTTGGNFISLPTQYLGCDAFSTQPLRLRNEADRPIEFFTGSTNVLRMRLSAAATSQTVNGFTGLDLSGYLGVGDFANVYPRAAAKVHVENAPSITVGYRPAMGDGFLSTQGEALFYSGSILNGESGIMWSYATGAGGTPRPFRFIYTGDNQTTTIAGDSAGLEVVRIQPDSSLNEGFFGIGDWNTALAMPNERLDILDRTIRLRDFGPVGNTTYLNQAAEVNRVLVADEDDGRVYWRPISDLGVADCDWTVLNANTSGSSIPHHVTTATGTNNSCPDASDNVGIGTINPTAKLHVIKTVGGLPGNHAGWFDMQGTTGINAGLRAMASGSPGTECYGVQGRGYNASGWNYGVHGWGIVEAGNTTENNQGTYGQGLVQNSASATWNMGLNAMAQATGSATYNCGVLSEARGIGATTAYGLRAKAIQADENYGVHAVVPVGTTNWAGYFSGKVMITDSAWVLGTQLVTSDVGLKQNIQDVQNALALLEQLAPKTYTFDAAALPQATLPGGPQLGLIAQEVEAVLPQVVGSTVVPAELDSLGQVVHPAKPIKGVDYLKLIPLLIAGMQEQQAQIQQLQQDLATCCTLDDSGLGTRSEMHEGNTHTTSLENDRLTIAPNPFQERTTLSYLVEAPARVRLQVHTESGMHLATLRDQPQEPGNYSMTWNTQDLAPGLYYVTLFADGKPVVKKAVKVR